MESNILEMNKTISISSKNQITIPKKVMEYLGFTKEAKIKVSKRSEDTRLNSSHTMISYAVFCLKKKK